MDQHVHTGGGKGANDGYESDAV